MEQEIIQVNQAETLSAIDRAEIDIQIATAKRYPRDIHRALAVIKDIATLDTSTAEDCFYALRRQGTLIEGVSVRLAEIIANAWGNLRVQTQIIGNDGKTITARGICHDLEANVAVAVEVKRRITDKNGRTYSEDMQVTTGNAASAIAYRNAVLKVVPKAVTSRVITEIKDVAMGKSIDLETRRKRMLEYYQKIGVSQAKILSYCHVNKVEQIDGSMIFELSGLKNAIKEGTTTVQQAFDLNTADSEKIADEARKKAEETKSRIEQASAQATAQNTQETQNQEK